VKRWSDRLLAMVCTSGGLGFAPVFPGTFGTLPATALAAVILHGLPSAWRLPALALALAACCLVSLAAGAWAIRSWGRDDPGQFTVDELAGQMLTVLIFPGLLPAGLAPDVADGATLARTVLWAFLAFRVFDIAKPPPAAQLERLHGSWGILADDLCAGVYAGMALHVLYYFAPALFTAAA